VETNRNKTLLTESIWRGPAAGSAAKIARDALRREDEDRTIVTIAIAVPVTIVITVAIAILRRSERSQRHEEKDSTHGGDSHRVALLAV
jgi:hypothetical protein